jgi:hypothetical protein
MPKLIEVNFADLERQMIALNYAIQAAGQGITTTMTFGKASNGNPLAPLLIRQLKPAKSPKHHSHLIEAENRKARRPRR